MVRGLIPRGLTERCERKGVNEGNCKKDDDVIVSLQSYLEIYIFAAKKEKKE